MQTGLRGRDLISLSDWTDEEVQTALDVAFELKRKRALGERHAYLRDKTLAMLFFYASTRTRASFEAGIAQLGGHGLFIESRTTQIAHGDTATEIGQILGRYHDGIAIRHVTFGEGNQYINEVAAASRVPVLNMQCDVYHPFQILADLMTIIEKKGRLRGQSITVSWAYASSYQKPISVPQSLILAATRFGMHVRLVHPPEFGLMPAIVAEAEANAARSGGSLEQIADFDTGFEGADVVYAKSWGAPLLGVPDEEGARIAAKYTDWISDERRMALTRDDAIWMHPLPADRNVEVADAVIDGPKSAAFDEAENRLHVQKAVMALTMG
jgi:N-acetylornithine carbamoyltransferase